MLLLLELGLAKIRVTGRGLAPAPRKLFLLELGCAKIRVTDKGFALALRGKLLIVPVELGFAEIRGTGGSNRLG